MISKKKRKGVKNETTKKTSLKWNRIDGEVNIKNIYKREKMSEKD